MLVRQPLLLETEYTSASPQLTWKQYPFQWDKVKIWESPMIGDAIHEIITPNRNSTRNLSGVPTLIYIVILLVILVWILSKIYQQFLSSIATNNPPVIIPVNLLETRPGIP